ncbi:hypothetical protein Dimus_023461 [Dionaea muscipula]
MGMVDMGPVADEEFVVADGRDAQTTMATSQVPVGVVLGLSPSDGRQHCPSPMAVDVHSRRLTGLAEEPGSGGQPAATGGGDWPSLRVASQRGDGVRRRDGGNSPAAGSIPLEERSRAVSFVFGGLSVGSVIGLILAPPIIRSFGWESVFYLFGLLGIAWICRSPAPAPALILASASCYYDTDAFSRLLTYSESGNESWFSSFDEFQSSLKDVPWKAFFQSEAVWAMIYAHFCGSWGHFTCLSWLPTYFSSDLHGGDSDVHGESSSAALRRSRPSTKRNHNQGFSNGNGIIHAKFGISDQLDLNLTEAAWVSVLPPLASIFVTNIAAQLADNLIARGVDTTTVCDSRF